MYRGDQGTSLLHMLSLPTTPYLVRLSSLAYDTHLNTRVGVQVQGLVDAPYFPDTEISCVR